MTGGFDLTRVGLRAEEAARVYADIPELKEGICPTCGGDGTYRHLGAVHRCDCDTQITLCKHYQLAGVGLPYQRLDWTDYQGDREPLKTVFTYLEHHRQMVARGMGLLFTGANGVGKTLLAMLVLKQLVRYGYRCFATRFSDTVDAFTASWYDDDERRRFEDRFIRSRVLLLDDLGKEYKGKNHQLPQSTFDRILRARVQNARPTLLTTNMTEAELGRGYGAGALSQLRECSVILEFAPGDFRDRARERNFGGAAADELPPII